MCDKLNFMMPITSFHMWYTKDLYILVYTHICMAFFCFDATFSCAHGFKTLKTLKHKLMAYGLGRSRWDTKIDTGLLYAS